MKLKNSCVFFFFFFFFCFFTAMDAEGKDWGPKELAWAPVVCC